MGAARRAAWQRNHLSDKPIISPPGLLAMQPTHDHIFSCFSVAPGHMPPWLRSLATSSLVSTSLTRSFPSEPTPQAEMQAYGKRDGELERNFYRRAAHENVFGKPWGGPARGPVSSSLPTSPFGLPPVEVTSPEGPASPSVTVLWCW